VIVKVLQPGKLTEIEGWGHDLSRGGLAVDLPVDMALGQAVEMTITLRDSGRQLQVQGTVRNRSGFRYGISFKATEEKVWPSAKLGR
jgi:hypothetical protein